MNLFDTVYIGSLKVRNHFLRFATYEGKADPDGSPNEEITRIYRELAEGGIGTIITSYTYIADYEKPADNQLGIYSDELTDKYRAVTEAAHSGGSKIIMQLVHGSSCKQADPDNGRIIGPSAIAHPDSGLTPKEMSISDIADMAELFAKAAARAKDAGFDGVQIHAAHGYQLSQWITPIFNRRTDEYGGSALNRFRIISDVYYAVREAVGADFPVWIKINSSDEVPGGIAMEDFLEMGREAARIGIDAIEVSGNRWRYHPETDRAYYKEAAVRLAELIDKPVILTGGLRELAQLEEISRSSKVNLFGFSRPLITDPGFISTLK